MSGLWQDLAHGAEGSRAACIRALWFPCQGCGEILQRVGSEKQAHLLLSSRAWHPPKIITVDSQLLELRACSTPAQSVSQNKSALF